MPSTEVSSTAITHSIPSRAAIHPGHPRIVREPTLCLSILGFIATKTVAVPCSSSKSLAGNWQKADPPCKLVGRLFSLCDTSSQQHTQESFGALGEKTCMPSHFGTRAWVFNAPLRLLADRQLIAGSPKGKESSAVSRTVPPFSI